MDDMETTNALPPLSPTPVPLCVMDINMGTDQLKHTNKCNTIYYDGRYMWLKYTPNHKSERRAFTDFHLKLLRLGMVQKEKRAPRLTRQSCHGRYF